MAEPSPIQYFTTAAKQRGDLLRGKNHLSPLSELESKVLLGFVLAQEVAVNIDAVAVTDGIASIERYLPSMHEALAHLKLFHISLMVAPSYGAYTWPNSELRAFANSLAEVGIEMKYQAEIGSKVNGIGNGNQAASPQTQQLSVAGAALAQRTQELREFADTAYLFSEDLTRPFVFGWRSLRHSEYMLNELVTEALSARAIRGHRQQNYTLLNLIFEYRQTRQLLK